MNATIPLARLTVDDQWARLQSAGGMLKAWIRRDDVELVRTFSLPLHHAIRFESKDGMYDDVAFWTFSPGGAMEAFRQYGWKTEIR